MENTQSKIRPIKTEKQPGTMYCLGCKDFTHGFRPQEKKWQVKCLEKNQTVLFVSQISQDFKTKTWQQNKFNVFTNWSYKTKHENLLRKV